MFDGEAILDALLDVPTTREAIERIHLYLLELSFPGWKERVVKLGQEQVWQRRFAAAREHDDRRLGEVQQLIEARIERQREAIREQIQNQRSLLVTLYRLWGRY